jgi:general secretion pathway protein H
MELMVVLAIMGLALILAMPMLDRLLPGLELRTDTRNLVSALQEARARSIGRNAVVTVVVDQEQGLLKVDGTVAVRPAPRLRIVNVMGTGHSSANAVDGIRFFPDGTSTGGHLMLALGDRRKHVLVDWLTGAVSVSD